MTSKRIQGNSLKAEDVIQAVLLADNFFDSLAPYCLNMPLECNQAPANSFYDIMHYHKAFLPEHDLTAKLAQFQEAAERNKSLVPLVNVALIDYALEYLEAAGIHECFIYLCKCPDAVKEHLSTTRWWSGGSSMTIHVQTAEDCMSLGDVMRDVDAKALIQSDFLLMSVDCITNVDIVPIMKAHSERRKTADHGSVMTLLYREAEPGHPARRHTDQLLLAADAETGRVLHHQRLPFSGRGRTPLPLHIFQSLPRVEVRYDLLDPALCVCAPSVPQLFADNFDFQTRDHFVRGILVNEEIMGNTIYYQCVGRSYAAQVGGLDTLLAITRDVLDRWAHPVVPEASAPVRSHVRCIQRNVYRHITAKVDSGSRLEGSVSLAAGVCVGRKCRLLRCVLGPRCRLGDDVVLEDVILDADCVLGDRVRATRAVLGADVRVAADVVLKPGCVLGGGVRVEASRVLPADTLLTAQPARAEFDDDEPEAPALDVVGDNGLGFHYRPDGPLSPPPSMAGSDTEDSSEEQDDRGYGVESPALDDTRLFYNEVLDSLVRGFSEKIRPENLILEVNSSKFAYNVTVQELNTFVVKCCIKGDLQNQFGALREHRATLHLTCAEATLVDRVAILSVPEHGLDAPLPPAAFMTQLQSVIATFMPLLTNYIKSPQSEHTCLKALEAFSCEHASMAACLAKVLMVLYEKDILSEEAILSWHRDDTEPTPESARVRQQVRKLIEWLEQSDSDTGSEDDSA